MGTMTTLRTPLSLALILALTFGAFFLGPPSAFATTCGAGADIGGGQCRVFLTTGSGSGNQSWNVPTDWTSTNTIECIGSGGDGGTKGGGTGQASPGGGGGAYAAISSLGTLTPGGTATFAVGADATTTTATPAVGNARETYFDGSASSTASLSCAWGTMGGAGTTVVGVGGATTRSIGTSLGLIFEDAGQVAPEILSAGGTGVDLYKLATFTLTGLQVLSAKVDAEALRLTSLEDRMAALESGAISTSSGTPSFSTSTLVDALASLGIIIKDGIAQLDTLVARRFVALTGTDGAASAGSALIPAASTTVSIGNSLVASTTKVLITMNGPVMGSWWVSDKADGSFLIHFTEPQSGDVAFDYFLVQTDGTQQAPPSTSPGILAPLYVDALTSTTATPATPATTTTITSATSTTSTASSTPTITASTTVTTTITTVATSTPSSTTPPPADTEPVATSSPPMTDIPPPDTAGVAETPAPGATDTSASTTPTP